MVGVEELELLVGQHRDWIKDLQKWAAIDHEDNPAKSSPIRCMLPEGEQ